MPWRLNKIINLRSYKSNLHINIWHYWASQVVLVVKNPPANAVDMRGGFDPGSGRFPWRRRNTRSIPAFLPGEFHGHRSLAGYNPWGHRDWHDWSALACPYDISVTVVLSLSHVQFFVILQTVAHLAPLAMGFSRQKYWSRLPIPSPGDLPDPVVKPWVSYVSCIGKKIPYD